MSDTKPPGSPSIAATLTKARKAQEALNRAEEKSATDAAKRDAAVLAASQAGASRAALELATGLSTARITQVLRRARERAADLALPLN